MFGEFVTTADHDGFGGMLPRETINQDAPLGIFVGYKIMSRSFQGEKRRKIKTIHGRLTTAPPKETEVC